MDNNVSVGQINFDDGGLPLIGGPCVIESRDHSLKMAEAIYSITEKLDVPFIFKSSFDKANRSSAGSFRGPDMDEGLRILEDVKNEVDVPILTDVHLPSQCATVSEVADVLQIPAFLCRQTDLLVAAGETGKAINIKKGQFLAPGKMAYSAEKVTITGNNNILLTERGSSFGYGLVSDMTAITVMQKTGYPVIFDATHSAQVPGSKATTGGQRHMIPILAKAAVAAGCDGLFMEIHDNPAEAKSDAATQWPLDELKDLLKILINVHKAVK